MEHPIVLFVPQHSMSEEDLNRAVAAYPDILFTSLDLSALDIGREEPAVLDNGRARAVRERLEGVIGEDARVLVARGYNAACLKQLYPNLNAVELMVTSYDILRAIPPGFDGTAAVITSGLNILGLDLIAQRCRFKVLDMTHTPFPRLEQAIDEAVSKKADLIIGGAYTWRLARKLGDGPPAIQIPLGPESLRRAAREARLVVEAIREEREEQRYSADIMDMVSEGIVSVRDGRIHTVNRAAERLLGGDRAFLLGLPEDDLPRDFLPPPQEDGRIVTFRGATLLVRRTAKPGESRSYTLFLHEHDALSKMERSVRLKMSGNRRGARYTFADIGGMSPALSRVVAQARDYARSDAGILILGESGCGKEVFAQSIHYESARREGPFIAVNCAGFTRELLQSELFGYVAGAFTGASRQGKPGIFELAHEGTVFLDEIAEMDVSLQAALLRALQERYVTRLGSYSPIPVNVRLIAATNRDLPELVASGAFREDLYYRLNVLPLRIPPLRERDRDAIQLLALFLKRFAGEAGESGAARRFTLTPEAQALLLRHPWPGNVRELMNVARRIAVTCASGLVDEKTLRGLLEPLPALAAAPVAHALAGPASSASLSPLPENSGTDRQRAQLAAITEALEACDGNMSEAARRLGIARTTLWRRLKRFRNRIKLDNQAITGPEENP